jgi:preprotein translocase subunit SecG
MLTILLLVAHVAVSLVLILVVLLQTGKRADLAGAFGGGGSQTAFGARGAATFLSKATTWSAVTFMATSSLLGVHFGSESGESVVRDSSSRPAPTAPAPLPATPPAAAPQQAPASPSPAGPPPEAPEQAPGTAGQAPSPSDQAPAQPSSPR